MYLEVIEKALATLPSPYQIEWEENIPESPVRIKNKLTGEEKAISKSNWIYAISRLSSNKTTPAGKDKRFKFPNNGNPINCTVFSNGTVMIQGIGLAGKWTADNIGKICHDFLKNKDEEDDKGVKDSEGNTMHDNKPVSNVINPTPETKLSETITSGELVKEASNDQITRKATHEIALSSRETCTEDCTVSQQLDKLSKPEVSHQQMKSTQQQAKQKSQLMPYYQKMLITPSNKLNQQLTIHFRNPTHNETSISMTLTPQQIMHLLNLTQQQMMFKPKLMQQHKISPLKPSLQQMINFAEAFTIANVATTRSPARAEIFTPNEDPIDADNNNVTETTEKESAQAEDVNEENDMTRQDLSVYLLSLLPETLHKYEYRNSQLIPEFSDDSDNGDHNLTNDQFMEMVRNEYENPSPPHSSVLKTLDLLPRTSSTPIIKAPKLIIKPNESNSQSNLTKLGTIEVQQQEKTNRKKHLIRTNCQNRRKNKGSRLHVRKKLKATSKITIMMEYIKVARRLETLETLILNAIEKSVASPAIPEDMLQKERTKTSDSDEVMSEGFEDKSGASNLNKEKSQNETKVNDTSDKEDKAAEVDDKISDVVLQKTPSLQDEECVAKDVTIIKEVRGKKVKEKFEDESLEYHKDKSQKDAHSTEYNPEKVKTFYDKSGLHKENGRPICKWYLRNSCKFGRNCWNAHVKPSTKQEISSTGEYSPQGLANTEGNMCFALSAAHMLSRLLPTNELRPHLANTLHKTRNLLDGKYEDKSAKEISKMLWAYSTKAWPDYKRRTKTGRCEQHDAAEYLFRIMNQLKEENRKTTECLTSTINSTTRCTDENCENPITSTTAEEHMLATSEIPNNTEISLQTIVDNFIPQLMTQRNTLCDQCGGDYEVTNTLTSATPTIIIHVNKLIENNRKTDTEIQINEVIRIPTTENPMGETYKVTDAIIHHGKPADGDSHYITMHYKEDLKVWEEINDAKINVKTSKEEVDNMIKQGVVYVLQRTQTRTPESSSNMGEYTENQETETNSETIKSSENNRGTEYRNCQETNNLEPTFIKKDLPKHSTKQNSKPGNKPADKDNKALNPMQGGTVERKNPWKPLHKRNLWSMTSKYIEEYPEIETKSNKRHYTDRDQPVLENRNLCWWKNSCKFGDKCWFSHEEQPFHERAQ